MAYTFFPKDLPAIESTLKKAEFPEDAIADAKKLLSLLKRRDPTPINFDLKKKRDVNISRTIQDDMSIAEIKSKAGITTLKMKFGNGSSGNRGANNRGNLFEGEFTNALTAWWEGETVSNKNMLTAIEDLDKTYDLSNYKQMLAVAVGGENTRRPLMFSPRIQLKNPKGSGFDVGESVTDVTVHLNPGRKKVFLSLKLGGTTTFFNVGVKTILPKSDIQNLNIRNRDGKKLLKMFGIDEEKFCQVFNGTGNGSIDNRPRYDRKALQHLLESGIGYNYHIIHKLTGRILSKEMSKAAMKKAARVGAPKIYYGGKGGRGRRIDIEMMSPTYIFKLNLRDTQGKDGYPSRLMCDFKYR
tara:strand:+ start:80 stop:1144 length:1065 start_codon:yes stop_codon:yes gene_type:complete